MIRSITGFLLSCFICLLVQGQPCQENFLGSKTLYESQQTAYSPVPRGYVPVFINHVGRHGSRHLTKEVNTAYIYALLFQADSVGGLTAAGRQLREKILRLEKVEQHNYKSISLRGKLEQKILADRMLKNYPNVFNTAKPILNVCYTKEIRTAQTSSAFLTQLQSGIRQPAVTKQVNDTILRFYDMCPAYTHFKEHGAWRTYLQQLKDSLNYDELATQVSKQFFTEPFLTGLSKTNLEVFTSDLFGFVAISYSIEKEIEAAGYTAKEVDIRSFLSCEQLSVLSKIDNAEDYFLKGPGIDADGIQVKIAVPLLADFISTTDEYIKNKGINVQLRFSHAETISPFAALLSITPASETAINTTSITQFWNAERVIPLSANIQWVLYRKPGDRDYLVKFLLNEKEVPVKGLSTTQFPFYKWQDVRAFYIKKIESLHANLTMNFVQYLQELQ